MTNLRGSRRNLIALAGVCGLSAGAWAGLDSAGQINGFYTTTTPVFAAIPPAPKSTAAWEWGQQGYAAPPPAGTVWGREIGPDERAFFDAGNAIGEEEPVRVHRASAKQVKLAEPRSLPEPSLPEPSLDAEEPVDG